MVWLWITAPSLFCYTYIYIYIHIRIYSILILILMMFKIKDGNGGSSSNWTHPNPPTTTSQQPQLQQPQFQKPPELQATPSRASFAGNWTWVIRDLRFLGQIYPPLIALHLAVSNSLWLWLIEQLLEHKTEGRWEHFLPNVLYKILRQKFLGNLHERMICFRD